MGFGSLGFGVYRFWVYRVYTVYSPGVRLIWGYVGRDKVRQGCFGLCGHRYIGFMGLCKYIYIYMYILRGWGVSH